MKKILSLCLLVVLSDTSVAKAEIYKRIDADGHVTYSGTPFKGAKKIELTPLATEHAHNKSRKIEDEPVSFPKVDAETQKDRDNARKQILEAELTAEEKALSEALDDAKEGGVPVAQGNEKKVSEANLAAQKRVQMHEKNIEALRIELSNSSK